MDSVTQWAVTVCVCVALSGILLHAVPKGNLKKCAEFAVVLFVTAAFFLPLAKGKADFEFDFSENKTLDSAELESNVDSAVVGYVESELSNEVISECEKKGIRLKNVSVSIMYTESGEVSVKEVKVNCPLTENQKLNVRSVCEELFSQEVKVIIEQ